MWKFFCSQSQKAFLREQFVEDDDRSARAAKKIVFIIAERYSVGQVLRNMKKANSNDAAADADVNREKVTAQKKEINSEELNY